jgi:hypothetical protein
MDHCIPTSLETKEIPLTQSKTAIIDASSYDFLMQWKWCAASRRGTFYAIANIPESDGSRFSQLMHRLIMGNPEYSFVDHIDGNGLNNCRNNLRLATPLENARNRGPYSKQTTSVFKGVSWSKEKEKWQASIRVPGRKIFLGRFDSEIEAALAYDNAARIYHSDFAFLNSERIGLTRK